ncbi:hypothetical protein SeMB42_g03037 [Synchytrium endobioticum]|uniref:Muskelin N-terminal domain-containing protein n=1 Tax=Synchytrium endobioticum TaxID=286115 RepID=A0A507DAE9_9FUNG|nr:hypothetical protein SeMB42_g03037 [Synchytrium endobioticum]
MTSTAGGLSISTMDSKPSRLNAPLSTSVTLASTAILPSDTDPNCSIMPPTPHILKYDIHAWSSHSASYHPSHILVNKPNDQGSRWSSGSNNQSQFITIKLDRMSIVQTISFGKYHKVHVCNLKEFKVFGGIGPDNMVELLHSGLRNDTDGETFSLKYKVNNVVFPCLYIKILPLLAWGANFNFSIWFVELRGLSQPQVVDKAYWDYINYREHEVVRLCLKHFRQRNYLDTFSSLQQRAHIQLEDPLLSELHKSLVSNGDFAHTEKLLIQAADRNLFQDHIASCEYKPFWRKILPADDGCEETPCMRGGHQMTIDVQSGFIYMIGGWDGSRDLPDFWAYDQNSRLWMCISADTARNGGPGPRSCHKICWDPKSRCLYLLGRYVDPDNRPNVNLESDFWRYDVATAKWTRISANTTADGGPDLIYDHQMCVDPDTQILYVFGGRAIGPDPSQTVYSGLYAYCINQDKWRVLRQEGASTDGSVQLRSRIGHSMLLNHITRELYIFAGQRFKDYLADFYVYDIENDVVHEIARDYSKAGGPDGGFTQRATIDIDLGELYVFSGLIREKASGPQGAVQLTEAKVTPNGSVQLRSRIGHSMLLNHITRELYIFAGQRFKDYLADFYVYDIENDVVHEIARDYSKAGGPDGGFTQRATIDIDLGELYVFSGLMREKASGPQGDSAKNSFWVYSIRQDKWTRIYSNDNIGAEYWAQMVDKEPCPRFAHQLVYDSTRKVQYLFGGNPGEPGQPNLRLDDFWELSLVRPTCNDILRRSRFMIKKQQFRELCMKSSIEGNGTLNALAFLQHELAAVVNHQDEKESKEFRELTQWLFKWNAPSSWGAAASSSCNKKEGMEMSGIGGMVASPRNTASIDGIKGEDAFLARTALYEQLLEFFPESMREPRGNLVDLVPII